MSKQERSDKNDANRSQDRDRHDAERHNQRSDDSKRELKKDEMDKTRGGSFGPSQPNKNPKRPQ